VIAVATAPAVPPARGGDDRSGTSIPAEIAPVVDGPDDAEEARLVADFRAGDVAAFEQIYRLHHRYVQLQARRVISDPHRAEDIAQEAFLRLTRQLQGGDGQIRLSAWLHRTTTNLAIDEHRRARTRQQYQDQGPPIDQLQNALERYDEGHPERMAEQSEVRATILEVVGNLPLRYRRILALRELDGLDYPSIAVAMGISVSAVESLLFRARRRFTQVYEELTDDVRPGRRRGRAAPAQG
jgi:RNA polymerase sigma factor (sigma-70 family)